MEALENQKIQIRRILVENSPPYVSAKSWAIADGETGDLLFSKGENERREIASLTKIMTAYTSLDLSHRFKIDLRTSKITISCKATRVIGTRARLQQGDTLTLWDLFHGLMLPSGNDAALALAEHFGELLIEEREKMEKEEKVGMNGAAKKKEKPLNVFMKKNIQMQNPNFFSNSISKNGVINIVINTKKLSSQSYFPQVNLHKTSQKLNFSLNCSKSTQETSEGGSSNENLSPTPAFATTSLYPETKESKVKLTPLKAFVMEMNRNARLFGLTNTSYANPHGLRNYFNKSSSGDIAKLASIAMKNQFFQEIVQCKKYKCEATNRYGEEKVFVWRNTNKLLNKGYNGVKTGITPSAGPCLATSIKVDDYYLIVVILNSKTMEHRWKEIKKLTNWALERLRKISKIMKQGQNKKNILKKLQHV